MRRANKEQYNHWNAAAGRAWVDAQETLDQMLAPFEDLLIEAIPIGFDGSVLDIGCGTGSTTLAAARRLGEHGRCVGVDISDPMLDLARARARREGAAAAFVRADAQTYAFDPSSFDSIISRFGVMFFDDFVAAFANLRRAAKSGGGLRVVAWRSAAENPFMTTAERAAAPFLPNIPPRPADGPGQFAFGDARRVRRILEESGWTEIDIRPIEIGWAFPAASLELFFTRLGPLGQILQDVDEQTRTRVMREVRGAFNPYVHGAQVRFEAACWTVSARAPLWQT